MTDRCDSTPPNCGLIRSAAITSSLSRNAGGLFWSVRSLCLSLIANNCQTTVFGARDEYLDEDVGQWGEVSVSVQKVLGPPKFSYQFRLLERLCAYGPDIAHVHGLWMFPSLATVQWSKRIRPYVVSPHGMLDAWALRNSAWKKRLAAFLYEDAHLNGASCIRALCDAEAQSIRAYGLKNPIAIIPNGVDLPSVDLLENADETDRPYWENLIPKSVKVLLFLSRLHPKKGLLELIRAWGSARRRKVPGAAEWQLVIAGWDQGGHRVQLERLVRELEVESSVHFVGPQFDSVKAASFRRADAFVLPSYSEGLPMAVLEAWSYRLPVIMTRQCNLPEGFSIGAAIPVETEVESLVEGLAALFGMTDMERRAIGQNGRNLVERQFTWNGIGSDMVDVYRWILGGDSRPSQLQLD